MVLLSLEGIDAYRPIHFGRLIKEGATRDICIILTAWIIGLIACITLGVMSVSYEWYSLPVTWGGVDMSLTIYPPIVICMLWTLLFGYWWGAIPAYLSTLILSLTFGMDWDWAMLFAFSNPIGLAVFAIIYRAVTVQLSMRESGAILFFVLIAFFSSILASTGSFIWSYYYKLNSYDMYAIWQAWWVGGFLQKSLLVAPLLYVMVPIVEKWKNGKSWAPNVPPMNRKRVALLSAVVILAIGFFLSVIYQLNQNLYEAALLSGSYESLKDAFDIKNKSVFAVYWIMAITLVIVVTLGYKFFNLWLQTLDKAKLYAEEQARTDFLTGLYNRRAFFEHAHIIEAQARRFDHLYSIALIDIDHFKNINDTHGHNIGDIALKQVAQIIQNNVRDVDISARFGGEEFIILLPETSTDQAARLSDRILHAIRTTQIKVHENTILNLTVSIGIATNKNHKQDLETIVQQADQSLYHAKETGRNKRITFCPDTTCRTLIAG